MDKMPSFRSYIYGNVPVEVDIDRGGSIEAIWVLSANPPRAAIPVYDLDLSPEQTDKFEAEFHDEIEQCLRDHAIDEAEAYGEAKYDERKGK